MCGVEAQGLEVGLGRRRPGAAGTLRGACARSSRSAAHSSLMLGGSARFCLSQASALRAKARPPLGAVHVARRLESREEDPHQAPLEAARERAIAEEPRMRPGARDERSAQRPVRATWSVRKPLKRPWRRNSPRWRPNSARTCASKRRTLEADAHKGRRSRRAVVELVPSRSITTSPAATGRPWMRHGPPPSPDTRNVTAPAGGRPIFIVPSDQVSRRSWMRLGVEGHLPAQAPAVSSCTWRTFHPKRPFRSPTPATRTSITWPAGKRDGG